MKQVCSGCGVCSSVCPVHAIKMIKNQEGFYEAVINKEVCIKCGLCERICPNINVEVSINKVNAYSYTNPKKSELIKSTSGGIGRTLINHLSKEYKVVGVKYNYETNEAEHIICNNKKDFDLLYGSKYMPSDFATCLKNMNFNEKYLVFGTPCQIAGLDNYLRIIKKRHNFILVDFFCHGVPSLHLWHTYLSQQKCKNIKSISFRSKKLGWHNYTMNINSDKGSTYNTFKDNDMFYKFFLANVCLGKTCYNCLYRCKHSKADIRIGDMWGSKYHSNEEGVSGILTFTEIGDKVINNISNIKKETVFDVTEEQMKDKMIVPSCRTSVIRKLEKKRNLKLIYYTNVIWYKIFKKIGVRK